MIQHASTWYTKSCPPAVEGVRLAVRAGARSGSPEPAAGGKEVITKDEFLALLVAQLKARDILDTGSPSEFVGQLAQLSTVEGIENLSERIGAMVALSALSQASSMLGNSVTGVDPESGTLVSGKVTGVNVIDGVPTLCVGGAYIPLSNLVSIS